MIVIVGFFPPINLSWLRAFNIRFPGRIPMASSNDASVSERAKLTCFVLFLRGENEIEINSGSACVYLKQTLVNTQQVHLFLLEKPTTFIDSEHVTSYVVLILKINLTDMHENNILEFLKCFFCRQSNQK